MNDYFGLVVAGIVLLAISFINFLMYKINLFGFPVRKIEKVNIEDVKKILKIAKVSMYLFFIMFLFNIIFTLYFWFENSSIPFSYSAVSFFLFSAIVSSFSIYKFIFLFMMYMFMFISAYPLFLFINIGIKIRIALILLFCIGFTLLIYGSYIHYKQYKDKSKKRDDIPYLNE